MASGVAGGAAVWPGWRIGRSGRGGEGRGRCRRRGVRSGTLLSSEGSGGGWRIRAGRASDLGRIRELVVSEAMNPLQLDPARFSVAEDAGGRVVGCGQVRQGDALVEVRSLVVDAELRGRGLGSELLAALLSRAPRGRDVHLLTIGSRVDWYERFGFRETDDVPTLEMKVERCLGTAVAKLAAQDRCLAMVRRGEEN